MLYFDVDGALQTFEETLVSGENVVYEAHSNAMLVLFVLQFFVLLVIALFTIVRRSNND